MAAALPANLQASANFSIPGVGTANDMFQGLMNNSPNASALAAQLNTYASDPNLTATATNAAEGIAAATQGKAPTEAQVEAIATGVATAAAVVAGVGLTAAGAVMAPLAAVVFGAGLLLGEGIKKIFHITNCGLTSGNYCDGKAPKNPGQPGFISYGQLIAGKMSGGVLDPNAKPAPWQPYTHGAFETAMRPVIMKIIEVYGNCGALPGVKDERVALQGLINFWNAHAPPGTPMRTITWLNDDYFKKYPNGGAPASYMANTKLWGGDPIQQMMFLLYDEVKDVDCRETYVGKPWPWYLTVADIPVAAAPPPAAVAQHVISLKLGVPSTPPKVIPLTLHGAPVPAAPQPSQVGGPLVSRPLWKRALPFAPAVVGVALFPLAGITAPILGGAASALWVELRK